MMLAAAEVKVPNASSADMQPILTVRKGILDMKKTLLAAAFALSLGFSAAVNALPTVKIIATGGTIAGAAASATDTTGYDAAAVGIQTLINAVPQMKDFAEVSGEQIAKISSNNMDTPTLLKLAKRVNELVADPKVDGVVITHGTDTIEETAYFLNLTVKSDKPVVLVGAMRPSTAISADGPMNLLEAVQTAASPKMKGQGVTIVMNDQISAARETTKGNTTNVATFSAPEMGYLGYVVNNEPVLYRATTRRHTFQSEFDISKLDTLPRVDIVYSHIDQDEKVVEAVLKLGAKGIVSAGTGNGSVSDRAEAVLEKANKSGTPVVLSAHVPAGGVVKSHAQYVNAGFVFAGNLNPQKARLLLQLALTKTNDPKEIQRIFSEY